LSVGATISDKRTADMSKKSISGVIGITLTIIGFLAQVVYFISRWIAGVDAPVVNVSEVVIFLGMTVVVDGVFIYFIYRLSVLGLFALPLALLVIAYGSMFPTEISPLVPSLQSNWLFIHVITVSIAQGILAISFVAGLIYLILKVDQKKITLKNILL